MRSVSGPILVTREWLDGYSKRGPASASFARFMEEAKLVKIIEHPLKEE